VNSRHGRISTPSTTRRRASWHTST
jgi:hypothetical protein